MDILFSIQNQRLRCRSTDVYVEGSRDYLNAVFDVSEDWSECIVTAYFQHENSEDIIARILDDNMSCKVPTQVIEDGEVKVWVRGDSTQTITTNEVTLTIYNTGDFDVGADLYNQVLAIMRDTKDMANAAVNGAGGALESAECAEAAAQEAEAYAAVVAEDRKIVEDLADQVLGREVSWDDIANKPTEFTPEAHEHDTSDIVGLDERLEELSAQSGGAVDVRTIKTEDSTSVLQAMNTMAPGLHLVQVEAGCVENPISATGNLSGFACVDELHDEDCYYGWIMLTDEVGCFFTQSVVAGKSSGWKQSNASGEAGVSYTFGTGLHVQGNAVSVAAATTDSIGGVIAGDGLSVDENGTLRVQSVSIDQLVQGDEEIVINGGSVAG